MKLSLVTETFPPEINGVSMTLGRLVTGLAERRVNVSVVAPERTDRHGEAQGSVPLLGVPGIPLPRYPELRLGLPAHRLLKRHWSTHRPDCVHIATEGPLGWSARRVSEELEIPVVSSFHTNFHSYGRHYGFGLLKGCVLAWLRAFHNATLRTFVPSDDLLDDLSASGFRRLRIFSRGVDTRLFNPANRGKATRERWGLKADEPAALYVGRLASEKNLDLVRQAYLEMRNRLPDLKMVFVGDGPARAALEQQLPEATFTGMLQGDDLSRAYASADVFLFPSLTETFGNVVTEAMASGLPVLAFAYAAPRRFIRDGENGFLAPFGNSAAYLAKARLLAGQRHDWARMGTAARATLLPHAWDAIIDAYLKELNSIPHVPAP